MGVDEWTTKTYDPPQFGSMLPGCCFYHVDVHSQKRSDDPRIHGQGKATECRITLHKGCIEGELELEYHQE